MHIRHFILMGVFLGAAAFLPNHAFAEKDGAHIQPEPQNSTVHTLVLEKGKNQMAAEKAVPVTPENVHKSQSAVVPKSETNPRTQQNAPIEPVPEAPNKSNRSNKAVPSLEKKMNAGKPAEAASKVQDTGQTAEPSEKVKNQGQTERAKVDTVTQNLTVAATKPLATSQTNSEVETNSQPPGLKAKSETVTEDTGTSVSIKTSSSHTLTKKPLIDEENKTPSNNRKDPLDIVIMHNPAQRTQSSGGQSNEQFSPEAGTTSFIANWFDWDEYFGLKLGHIYTSRQAKYFHQWINAPPSPPPKAAPFFNVISYLAKCNDY